MKQRKMTDKELDKLLDDWSEMRLELEEDARVTDSLISFVEDDDDIDDADIKEMMECHIHSLSQEEITKKRRFSYIRWVSVAASVCLVVLVSIAILYNNIKMPDNANVLIAQTDTAQEPASSSPDSFFSDSIATMTAVSELQATDVIAEVCDKPVIAQKNNTSKSDESPRSAAPIFIHKEDFTVEEKILREAIQEMVTQIANNEKELTNVFSEIDIDFTALLDDTFTEVAQNVELLSYHKDELNNNNNTSLNASQRLTPYEADLIDAFSTMRKLNVTLNLE